MIKVIKYLPIFQTWPLQANTSCSHICASYIEMTAPSSAQQPSFSLPAARARLSLVHIEYLYSKRLGSRSLISKVTCWASAGSAGALSLAWDEVTWDIMSPQCVLLFYRGKGLCFVEECLHHTHTEERSQCAVRVRQLWSNYHLSYPPKYRIILKTKSDPRSRYWPTVAIWTEYAPQQRNLMSHHT